MEYTGRRERMTLTSTAKGPDPARQQVQEELAAAWPRRRPGSLSRRPLSHLLLCMENPKYKRAACDGESCAARGHCHPGRGAAS
jgi:hypothetical protein